MKNIGATIGLLVWAAIWLYIGVWAIDVLHMSGLGAIHFVGGK